jgi:hypothetical protein
LKANAIDFLGVLKSLSFLRPQIKHLVWPYGAVSKRVNPLLSSINLNKIMKKFQLLNIKIFLGVFARHRHLEKVPVTAQARY